MPQLLGVKLRYLRNYYGLTQSQVAQLLSSTSYKYIQMIEKGQRVPTIQWVIRIAMLLDQSTDYLLRDALPIESAFQGQIKPIKNTSTSAGQFGSKIQRLRKKAGWSQFDLTRELGLSSQGSVSKLESGHKMPSLELALEIADIFQVSTDYLLRDDISVENDGASVLPN